MAFNQKKRVVSSIEFVSSMTNLLMKQPRF